MQRVAQRRARRRLVREREPRQIDALGDLADRAARLMTATGAAPLERRRKRVIVSSVAP